MKIGQEKVCVLSYDEMKEYVKSKNTILHALAESYLYRAGINVEKVSNLEILEDCETLELKDGTSRQVTHGVRIEFFEED